MFPFDPEMTFGPWMFYIGLAVMFHTAAQALLASISLVFQRAQGLLMTLGTSLAMCSGAGFLLSFAWGSDMEDPQEAFDIAWRLVVGAGIAGPLLFAWALSRWRELYDEMASPTWAGLTNLGGCATFACFVGLNFVTNPQVQLALALGMLFFLATYWSPVFLLPWRYLTRMDPMNFVRFLVLLLAVGTAEAAPEVKAKIEGRLLTLSFPETTRRDSVWLQLDGRDVPRRMGRWSGGTLALDLHRVKQRLGTKWVTVARVWGQQADGTSLWQAIQLPGRTHAGDHSVSCGCR